MRYRPVIRLTSTTAAGLALFFGVRPLYSQSIPLPSALRQQAASAAMYLGTGNDARRLIGCSEGVISVDCPAASGTRNTTTLPDLEDLDGRAAEPAKSQQFAQHSPEPPSEFQRFIQSSTGHLLPIYGASLFDRVPSTFSPVDKVPITPDYVIGPGDQIDVRAWGQVNLNQRFTVDRTGDIFLPQAGRIAVAGLKFDQVRMAIDSSMRRVFRNFDIDVNMGQLRSIQIFVVGQARRPGSYTVSSLSTLVNALFATGGPSTRGSLRSVQLQRRNKPVTTFDLYELLLRGDMSKDASLMSGDVIFIPDAGPRIALDGSVGTPAIYEMKSDTTLEDVLGYAGGLSQPAARDKAILERFDKRPALHSDNIELTPEGLKMHPQDGDIVRILPVVARFDRTVTLRGNVADPVRYPWRPGMRVSDLIPEPDRLLTRGYWNARNALLKPESVSPLYKQTASKSNSGSSLAAAVIDDQSVIKEFIRQTDLQPLAPNIDWSYATIERLDSKELGTHLLSFNLKAAVLNHDPSADLLLEPSDIVTVFSDADITLPRLQQTRYVRVEGEVTLAGVYSVRPGETLRDIVVKAGGLTPNAYLYGAQFTRESTRKEQQQRFGDYLDTLERDTAQHGSIPALTGPAANRAAADEAQLVGQRQVIERLRRTPVTGRVVLDLHPNSQAVDALPELPLENGDTLLVPSTPSTVNVLGMVYNQGSFVYRSGSSLRDYLAHSGGPSRYADRKHVFIIRADGSVVAKGSRSKLFFNDFESLPMYPGDTIVVPAYVKKGTFLNTFANWSQIVGGLGVSAAAVNVLR